MAIFIHPDNLPFLRRALAEHAQSSAGDAGRASPNDFAREIAGSLIPGIPVYARSDMPKLEPTGRIIWPQNRFVEYEKSDEGWGLALGLAKREMRPVIWLIDESVFLPPLLEHPVLFGLPDEIRMKVRR